MERKADQLGRVQKKLCRVAEMPQRVQQLKEKKRDKGDKPSATRIRILLDQGTYMQFNAARHVKTSPNMVLLPC